MIMFRYFLLVQLYHWTTFYQQTPWAFLIGIIISPYQFVRRMMIPPDVHEEMTLQAIALIKSYWEIPGTLPDPPRFVKNKFLQLESELKNR